MIAKLIAILWSIILVAPALVIFFFMEAFELAKLISLKIESFLRE